MKPTRLRAAAVAAVLMAGLANSAAAADKPASSDTKGMQHSEMKGHDMAGMSSEMDQMMMRNMKQMGSMKMSGDMDQDFATMMRHHHEAGIQMAEMELKNGKDPEMKRMAQQIVDSQKKEIDEFDQWLKGRKPAAK